MISSLNTGKRALTTAVAAATMLWSVGFSSFVAPLTARAATAGDVIKGQSLTTLYYYGNDGKRYAFPNEKTYLSWYSDFSGVQSISDSQLAAIPLGGNVLSRPGSFWVKIQSDPKTYAVTSNGALRWIETESVASGLAGSDWNKFIADVPDVFFADYTVGASLTSASAAYNGALVKDAAGSYYAVQNGAKRLVSSAGFSANRMQSRFALDGSGVMLSSMTSGSDVTAKEASLSDAAQLPAGSTGGLSASLASDTPAASTLPLGAASVPMFKFKLTAASGSANVSQVTLSLGGIGATSNFAKVYLYDGDKRLTTGRTVNSSTRQVTFGGLSVSLAAGETKTFLVKIDVKTSGTPSGDTASFSLASTSAIVSTASVSGAFPVSGNMMSFSNTAAGGITIAKSGSVPTPTIGAKAAQIGKFSLASSSEDASVKMINLTVDRTVDHSNYQLWKGSTLLAQGVPNGSYVLFTLPNPLFIQQGGTEYLTVTADIGGRANDNIKVSMEENTDLLAVGSKYGFNLAVTNDSSTGYADTSGSCASSSDACNFSTIQGGKLTFAFNGPTASDIQIDGKDQVLEKFTVTSQNYAEIRQMVVTVACSSGTGCDTTADAGGLLQNSTSQANLTDISLRKTDGTVWMGPQELTTTNGTSTHADDTTQNLTFTDTQTLQAGQSLDLMVTADIYTSAVADTKITSTVLMTATYVLAKDINGKDLVTADIVPASNLAGNNQTLKAAGITVSVAAPPGDGTYVRGSNNVPVVGYSFQATKSSLIKVTDLTLNAAGDSDGTVSGEGDIEVKNFVSSCSLYDGQSGALVDGPESPGTVATLVSTISFTNFGWVVPAGETSKLLVKCNFANVALDSQVGSNDVYDFWIPGATSITAEDKEGKSLATGSKTSTAVTVADVSSIPDITIANTGTLTITQDGSTPAAAIVLGGSTAVPVSVFKFQAANEDVLVKTLSFRNCVGMTVTTTDACNGGTETDGTNAVASSVKVSYQDASGATVTKSGILTTASTEGTVTFNDLGFLVPASTLRTMTVSIDTNAVSSTQGVTSGSQLQLNVVDDSADVVGMGSGQSITPVYTSSTNIVVLGNAMTIRKTKPTITLASGSPSGAGIPGLSEVFRFNVSADSRGFVGLNQVLFKVTTTDNAANDWNIGSNLVVGDFSMYDLNAPSTLLAATSPAVLRADTGAAATTQDVGYMLYPFTTIQQISAGTTKTFVLKVDTSSSLSASSAQDDSIRIDIPNNADVAALSTSRSSITWDDDVEATWVTTYSSTCTYSSTPTSDTCDDGRTTTGALLKNLPVTGGAIVY